MQKPYQTNRATERFVRSLAADIREKRARARCIYVRVEYKCINMYIVYTVYVRTSLYRYTLVKYI